MRSVLVSVLIVLQHAAQLPCRSVTKTSSRAAPASHEDLDSIIARNREITDLLIPLLEANLENKRHEGKKHDLLKVFRDSKTRKDPLVELLPLTKRQARERKPVALILASELRSRKSKKGRNKVHNQKTFIIQNNENVEGDYSDTNSVEDVDVSNENKYHATVKHEHWSTIETMDDDSLDDDDYDEDKPHHHKLEINVVKEDGDSDFLIEELEDVSKENSKETVQSYYPQFIESYSDEDDISESFDSGSGDDLLTISDEGTDEDSESGEPNPINLETLTLSSESLEDNNNTKELDSEDQSESYEESDELRAVRPRKKRKPTTTPRPQYDNDYYDSYEERKRLQQLHEDAMYYAQKQNQQHNAPANGGHDNSYASDDSRYEYDDDGYDSEYEDASGDSQYDNYVTNENDESESDTYNDDYYGDSHYYENSADRDYEDDDYDDQETDANDDYYSDESFDGDDGDAGYSGEADDYNSGWADDNFGGDDTYNDDTYNYDTYNDDTYNDATYNDNTYNDNTYNDNTYDTFNDNTYDTYNGDTYNNYGSAEYRKAEENVQKQKLTFSEEIAQKYAADSKYSVENDNSLIVPSGELSKFNVESVEGLIEVLKQDDTDDNRSKCDENDDDASKEDVPARNRVSDHSHEIHKSYKLSFKFNK